MSDYGTLMNEIVTRLKAELPYLNGKAYPIFDASQFYEYAGRKDPFVLVRYAGGPITGGHGFEDQDHGFIIDVHMHGWDKSGAKTYIDTLGGNKTIPDIVNEAKRKLDLYMFYSEIPNFCYHAAAQNFLPTASTGQLGVPDKYYNVSGGFAMLYQVEERTI